MPEQVETTTRDQLVREWRELWARVELAQGAERAALLHELAALESRAMALIIREQDDKATAELEAATNG